LLVKVGSLVVNIKINLQQLAILHIKFLESFAGQNSINAQNPIAIHSGVYNQNTYPFGIVYFYQLLKKQMAQAPYTTISGIYKANTRQRKILTWFKNTGIVF